VRAQAWGRLARLGKVRARPAKVAGVRRYARGCAGDAARRRALAPEDVNVPLFACGFLPILK
jgi:hypothetical protein